ncbi:MAG TPA: DUF92 domain-containing protein, partial [Woeseiaceae bacterium]|nr:DUF92 domain-containing protein [Woeseiaceae bacterium]
MRYAAGGVSMTVSISVAALAACAAAALAWRLAFLTVPAAMAAAIAAMLVLRFGGWDWGMVTAVMFFVTAWLSQRGETPRPRRAGVSAARRNLAQVAANGVLITSLAVARGTLAPHGAVVAAFL